MGGTVPVFRTVSTLRAQVKAWRAAGETVALVPTMGALHAGHLELVRLAKARCQRAVVSIFVNPAQFAPHEDFDRYPRDEAGDLAKLAGASAATSSGRPTAPKCTRRASPPASCRPGPPRAWKATSARISSAAWRRCAASCSRRWRPTSPCSARRTTSSSASSGRWCATSICRWRSSALPTVREADGLAMSSRNAYLSPDQRRIAPTIHRVITSVAEAARQGDRDRQGRGRGQEDARKRRLQGGLSRGARCRDPESR